MVRDGKIALLPPPSSEWVANLNYCCIACVEDSELLLMTPDAALQNPSESHGKETHDDQQVQKDIAATVHTGDVEVFSVAYVIDSIARQVLRGVSCDAYWICLTSEVQLPNVFTYFNEVSDTEKSLT
jgi:hypothetical protein